MLRMAIHFTIQGVRALAGMARHMIMISRSRNLIGSLTAKRGSSRTKLAVTQQSTRAGSLQTN